MKTIFGAALFVMAAVAIAGGRPSAAAEPCNPAGNLGFVCGPLNSEDLVSVPGTAWIVASGMDGGAAGSHGGLHLVDSRDKSWKPLFPGEKPQVRWDKATYGDCPSPPDLAKFSAHGLNLRSGDNGADTLYVVNHGGREFDRDFCARPQRSRAECRVGRLRGNAGAYLAELGGAAAGWRHGGDRHVRSPGPQGCR